MYDALNILEALGIITMDKKEIRWIGIENAKPIREVTRRVQLTTQSVSSPSLEQRERDGADESEEPEDDDMEIEQLQVRFRFGTCCSSRGKQELRYAYAFFYILFASCLTEGNPSAEAEDGTGRRPTQRSGRSGMFIEHKNMLICPVPLDCNEQKRKKSHTSLIL